MAAACDGGTEEGVVICGKTATPMLIRLLWAEGNFGLTVPFPTPLHTHIIHIHMMSVNQSSLTMYDLWQPRCISPICTYFGY